MVDVKQILSNYANYVKEDDYDNWVCPRCGNKKIKINKADGHIKRSCPECGLGE